MDAAPTGSAPSGGATASAPAPVAKLTIDKFADAGIVCLRFTGTIDRTTQVGDRAAIVPRITGSAYLTGFGTCLGTSQA